MDDISVKPEKVGVFFNDNNIKQLTIPKFQRGYVWGQDEVENFWTDFVATNPNTNLRLAGTVILNKTKSAGVYQVVDGQQRIVTSALFLMALRDVWQERFGLDETYQVLNRYLIDTQLRGDKVSSDYKIEPSLDIRDAFRLMVAKGGYASESLIERSSGTIKKDLRKLFEAYKMFHDKIIETSEGPRAEDQKKIMLTMRSRLLDGTNIVLITLHNEEDAYEVFEGFNARGIDLTISNLFKNLLLSKYKGQQQDEALEKWNEIQQIINDIQVPRLNLNKFLRYYWIAFYGWTTEKDLYRNIKKKTTDYDALFNKLYKSAQNLKILFGEDIYEIQKLIGSPTGNELKYARQIKYSLFGLRAMNTQSYLPWLISLAYYSPQISNMRWIANSVQSVEKFSFCYFAVANQPANRVEKLYVKLCSELRESNKTSKVLETIILHNFNTSVKELVPSRDLFLGSFNEMTMKTTNKNLIRYLFISLERSLSHQEIDLFSCSIEHILPQRPDTEWNLSQAEIKTYVNTVGNLTIVANPINGDMKNKVLQKKLPKLEESRLKINEDLIKIIKDNNYKWDEEEIISRQTILGAMMYDFNKINQ